MNQGTFSAVKYNLIQGMQCPDETRHKCWSKTADIGPGDSTDQVQLL